MGCIKCVTVIFDKMLKLIEPTMEYEKDQDFIKYKNTKERKYNEQQK